MADQLGAEPEIIRQARILWDYLRLGQPLRKSDCVIAMGSHDLRVGSYAARLVLEEWAPLLVCSGGLGRLTKEIWHEPEARKFARVAQEEGVPKESILVEGKSANTSENLRFSRQLLEENGLRVASAILAHKPYMERRVLAAAGVVWPDLDCSITSPPIPFDDYPTADIPMDEVIHIMVGDFQRIIIYGRKGYQTRQKIPQTAMDAFHLLVKTDYNRYLLNE